MKKYKTWEVIKMLTENPKLKFEARNDIGTILKNENRGVRFYENGENVQRYGVMIYEEWTLVQESVSFMEAIKAYHEGKPVRCELEGEINFKDRFKRSVGENSGGYDVENIFGVAIGTREILEGKWFIEECEE